MDRDADFETFDARVRLAALVTIAYPGRLMVVRCLCHDSVVTTWVCRGAVRHVVLSSWN